MLCPYLLYNSEAGGPGHLCKSEIQNSMAYKDYIVSLYTYNNYRETFKNRWNVGIWNELRRKTYLTDAGEWEKGSVLKTVEELRE